MANIPNQYGIATFKVRYTPMTRDMSITLGYRDTLAADDANAAATFLRGKAVAAGSIFAAAAMSTSWQFLGCTTLQRSTAGVLMAGADLTAVTGTVAAPTNVQPVYLPFVVSKKTAFAGKRYQGRMYYPMMYLAETDVDPGGTITAGLVASLQTVWNTFYNSLWPADIYPPFLLHELGGVVPLPTRVTSFLVRPVNGVQRRRRTRGA